jgi:hypothetical protein
MHWSPTDELVCVQGSVAFLKTVCKPLQQRALRLESGCNVKKYSLLHRSIL